MTNTVARVVTHHKYLGLSYTITYDQHTQLYTCNILHSGDSYSYMCKSPEDIRSWAEEGLQALGSTGSMRARPSITYKSADEILRSYVAPETTDVPEPEVGSGVVVLAGLLLLAGGGLMGGLNRRKKLRNVVADQQPAK